MRDMREIMSIIDAPHSPTAENYELMQRIDAVPFDKLQTDEERLIKIARHMRVAKNVPAKWVRWLLEYKAT